MKRTRDLGRIDVWQQSRERSLARRGKLPRSSPKNYRPRAERDLSSLDIFEESRAPSRRRRPAASKRSFLALPFAGLGAVSAVALLAAAQAPAATDAAAEPSMHDPPLIGLRAPDAEYVNPLARAKVTPERIDQGVDYAGTGTLSAIGWARITRVQRSNTGWPGAFIEYRLLHGYRAGRYVYYAEGVRPARGIQVGRLVRPGSAVARLIPGWYTGIEIGWGANIGTETLAAKFHEYSFPTRCGKNFSAFIASLGGPPGKRGAMPNAAQEHYGRP